MPVSQLQAIHRTCLGKIIQGSILWCLPHRQWMWIRSSTSTPCGLFWRVWSACPWNGSLSEIHSQEQRCILYRKPSHGAQVYTQLSCKPCPFCTWHHPQRPSKMPSWNTEMLQLSCRGASGLQEGTQPHTTPHYQSIHSFPIALMTSTHRRTSQSNDLSSIGIHGYHRVEH